MNAELPRQLGTWAAQHDASVLHYSTDYVFDGNASVPYLETDPTAPLGVYGATKLAGEHALRDSGCSHVVLRTAWVYDWNGRNFLRTMLRLAEDRPTLDIVDDQIGTPTSARLIAEASGRILEQWLANGAPSRDIEGIHHLTASGQTSWAGFAEAIFREAVPRGICAKAPDIRRIPSSAYPTPAKRPAWSVLDTTSLQRIASLELPHWEDELRRILDSRSLA